MDHSRTPRVYRVEALVLKSYDYGEADRILTLLTPTRGKVRAIAKGVRRTKSRKAGHLDLFTRSTLLIARGRQLDIVTQAETVEVIRPIREDLWRSSWAHYMAELVDGFIQEDQANYPVYAAMVASLRRLGEAESPELVVRAFELTLLALTGYRPQLHRCLHCETTLEPVVNRFSPRLGGVLCPACASADGSAPAISVNALKVLRHLQTNEGVVLSLTRLPDDVRREVERHMQEYLVFRLEARPRSFGVIERLRAEYGTA